MPAELHIRIHQDAEDPESILEQFPFEPGQGLIVHNREMIVIDLGTASDTTYVQDWYLNGHDGVASFFVASDDPEDGPAVKEQEP